ncbi:hypothetical protein U6G28_05725 [Actinomycetaceae bacterium MB13-C1-2]|nr:hypothetical protein U6G28_05725 [Actinomycetaceae bacterium MB13-C1-2]
MSYETVTIMVGLITVMITVIGSSWAMVRNLRTEMKSEFGTVNERIDGLRVEFKGAVSDLRTETRENFADLRDELRGDISSLRVEVTSLGHRINSTNSRIDRLADALIVPVGKAS